MSCGVLKGLRRCVRYTWVSHHSTASGDAPKRFTWLPGGAGVGGMRRGEIVARGLKLRVVIFSSSA